MGVKLSFLQMSNAQLQRHIRIQSRDSHLVLMTDHALERMQLRLVNDYEVMQCLREGMIQRPPSVDKKTGDLKCRMDHYGTARNLSVVVALDDDRPDVIVVTVIARTR